MFINRSNLVAGIVGSLCFIAGSANAQSFFGFVASYNRGNGLPIKTVVQTGAQGDDQAVAVDSNGKIVVAANVSGSGFLIGRFNSDLSPDTTFGFNGVSAVDSAHNGVVKDVGVDSSNRIYVLASGNQAGTQAYITRLSTNGTVDLAGYGYVVISANLPPIKLAVAPGGVSAVLFGSTEGYDYAQVGSNGAVQFSKFDAFVFPANGADTANGIAFDASGNIIVVGQSSNQKMGIARYNGSNGLRDGGFNGGATVQVDFGLPLQHAADVTVDGSGNLVVVGFTNTQTTQADFLLAKVSSSGTILNHQEFKRGGSIAAQPAVAVWSVKSSGSFYYVAGAMLTSSGKFQNSLFKLTASTFDFTTNFAHSGWMNDGITGYPSSQITDIAIDGSTNPVLVGGVSTQ